MIIAHRTNARCSDYASSHVFRTGSAALARNIRIESTFEDVKIGALRLGRSSKVYQKFASPILENIWTLLVGYSWERQGDLAQDLISELAGIGDDPVHDIRLVLEEQHNSVDEWGEEQEYGEEACYTDKAIFAKQFHFRWLEFVKSLRTEARLFNKGARELFEDIFAGISGTSYARRNEHHRRCRSRHQID